MTYTSGRTKEQFIRIAVLEGRKVYVAPRQFLLLQEAALGPEAVWPERVKQILMLTPDEYVLACVGGLDVVVDYELAS